MKKNEYKAIIFFCDSGGMTYELRQAGIDVVSGVDFAYKELHYKVKHEIVDMSYYEVPQSRKRFSLIAFRIVAIDLPKKDDNELQLSCFEGNDNRFKDSFSGMWRKHLTPTITTKFYSASNGHFAHPSEYRPISLREGTTHQTLPKNYIFKTNSIATTAKLIGNAVPLECVGRFDEVIINSEHK